MSNNIAHPFAYLESASEFIVLLQDEVVESSMEARGTLNDCSTAGRAKDVKLALLRLHQLSFTLSSALEILNDLTRLQAAVKPDSVSWREKQLRAADREHSPPIGGDI